MVIVIILLDRIILILILILITIIIIIIIIIKLTLCTNQIYTTPALDGQSARGMRRLLNQQRKEN